MVEDVLLWLPAAMVADTIKLEEEEDEEPEDQLLQLEEDKPEEEEVTMAVVVAVAVAVDVVVLLQRSTGRLLELRLSRRNKSHGDRVDKNFVKILKTPRVDFVVFSWFSSM